MRCLARLGNMMLKGLKVGCAITRSLGSFAGDDADFHILVHLKGQGDDAGAVQLGADDARAYGIAVQADKQVEQGCTVANADIFAAVERRGELLGILERIVAALLIRKERIALQFLDRHARLVGQRMFRAHEYVRARFKQGLENQIVGSDHFFKHLAVALA